MTLTGPWEVSGTVSTLDAYVSPRASRLRPPTAARPSQHIAFATDDIISASRRVRDSGRGLPVPDNCYDDLPARFASGSGELATDREPDILHDHDENGRFRPLE